MSQDTWKLENDLCRCCHSEGSYLCLSDTHEEDGEEFSYSNLLRETLDIDLTPMEGPLSMKTFTICYICILQLRNAAQFKRQVLMREERFKVMFSKIEVSIEDIKKEIIISDDDAMSDAVDFNNDDFQLDNPVKVEVPLLVPKEEKRRERRVRKVKPKVTTVVKKPKRTARAKKNKVETEMEGGAMADEDAASKGVQPARPPFRLQEKDFIRDADWYQCTRCDKRYDKIYSLRFHVKTKHYKIPRFPCNYCSEMFMTPAPLTIHKLQEHNIDERFKCNACKGTFNTKVQLRKHINNFHMMGEKYKCEFCEYESFSFEGMYKHKFKHKTVKDHHCKFCRKSFLRKTTLDLHERIHTGDRRKICKVCNQAFVQKASLNYHMSKYHPEVNY